MLTAVYLGRCHETASEDDEDKVDIMGKEFLGALRSCRLSVVAERRGVERTVEARVFLLLFHICTAAVTTSSLGVESCEPCKPADLNPQPKQGLTQGQTERHGGRQPET